MFHVHLFSLTGKFLELGLDYDDFSTIKTLMNLDVDLDEMFREEQFMAAETQWPTLRLIPQDDTLSDTKRHGTVNVSLYVIQQTPFNIDQDCSIHVKYPFLLLLSNSRTKEKNHLSSTNQRLGSTFH